MEFLNFQAEVADGNDKGDLELDFYEGGADNKKFNMIMNNSKICI